jgi:hypothetical protein
VKQLPACPQLAIYAGQDELISVRALAEYRERLADHVSLFRLKLSLARRYPRHLAIDPRTVGDSEWARMTSGVNAWLDGETPLPVAPNLPHAEAASR